jgi:predicted small lipoprotein YifL
MNRWILMSFIIALLVGPLAACGKKGAHKYPGESPYPRTYPKS